MVVLTTASRLREEIRSQLNETELCTCQPQNCTSLHEDTVDKMVTDSVEAAVSRTVENFCFHSSLICSLLATLPLSLPPPIDMTDTGNNCPSGAKNMDGAGCVKCLGKAIHHIICILT